MAKYIDLPNLKENLTNFLNKKINPIYAKKTEIPSNVSELNNDKSYQTAEEVGQAVTDGVARIVAGAPEDFDTLKEMSDWISSHETSAAAMNSAISDNSVAIANHTSNSDIHVTKEEKTKWNKLDSDLKDGTIIVAEATKATQDAQGNIINETYAKKTEVPQGTVVDDALSSTSTNPVQNKVVKAEFDHVNSNLSGQGDEFELGNLVANSYVEWTSGLIKSYDGWSRTDYIDISAITNLTPNIGLGTGYDNYNCFYDSSKNFISNFSILANSRVEIPQNAKYVIFSNDTSKMQNLSVKFDGLVKEFKSINESLGTLEFGEVAGGKNLYAGTDLTGIIKVDIPVKDLDIDKNKNYTFSFVITSSDTDTDTSGVFINTTYAEDSVKQLERNKRVYATFLGSKIEYCSVYAGRDWATSDGDTVTVSNIQIEEGTQVTDYEPYIPSIAMLAEENAQQNDSLSALGKCKNLLKPTLQTTTHDGVTCTKNSDGTYTFNGTATSKAVFYVNDANENIQNYVGKKLRLVGSPKGSGNTTYGVTAYITPKTGSTIYHNDYGEGKTFTVTDNMQSVKLYIEVYEGQSLDNLVFKPMLTTNLNATYDDFVPYTGDGDTLTADVAELKNDLSYLKDGTTPAAKAVADEDGNNIKSTYAKLSDDAKFRSISCGGAAYAKSDGCSAFGYRAGAYGNYSQAQGEAVTAYGNYSHAEGESTNFPVSIDLNESDNISTILSKWENKKFSLAKGAGSHAEGFDTLALGDYSHSEGRRTIAYENTSHAEGIGTKALNNQHALGAYNNSTTAEGQGTLGSGDGTALVIGNGTYESKSNAFRVNYNGEVFAKSATISTGADYAEYFEWEDENPNNEDRRGYFVTLNNKKIKLAKPNDYILGVISGFPSVIGNGDEEWMGRYVFDDFGAPVIEEFEYENPITGETKIGTKWKENPDYDNTRPYIQRSKRQEWDAVGMLGVLSVRDDGTCVPNKYCKITDGSIATLSEDKSDYRVLERVNDNVVKIVFR